MRYLLLIYGPAEGDPTADLDPDSPEFEAMMKTWWDYDAELREAGISTVGEALQPVTTATTVRVRDGQTLTTDGPFAETKEVLGGYYVLDVADLDEAIEWAAKCPAAPYGSVELRPIMEFDTPPDA